MRPLPYLALALLVAVRLWLVPYAVAHEPKTYSDILSRAVTIAIIVAAAAIIDGLIRQFYWHGHLKRRRNRDTPALIQDIVTVSLLLIGLALGFWWQAGLTLTGIAAASGAVAFVLGIALQPVIQDLFSGLSINFDGSYTLGEWITVYSDQMPEPAYGRVTGINWRTTFITTEDGRRIMVPNRLITSNPIANHSRAPVAKEMWLEVEVEIRIPQERVVHMFLGEMMKAVHAPGLARHPEPEVLVKRLTADAVIYEIRFSYKPDEVTPGHARSIVLRAVHEAIQKNDLPLPVTQIELTQPPNLEFPFGPKEIREALCGVPLFRDALDEQQFELLGSQCRLIEFSAGAELMRQGDQAATMYVIVEGAANITLTTPDGALHEVAASAAGDVAGEMSLMTGALRTASVTAATRVRALEITRNDIKQLLDQEPELYQRFAAILAKRQRELDAIAQRHADAQQVETDILTRMKAFFSRSFGMG